MKKKRSGSLLRRRDSFGLVFMIPWIIGFLMFFLYPFLRSVLLSLQKVTFLPGGGFSAEWVGLQNYITALTKDQNFLPMAAGSLVDLLVNVPVCLVFSFFVAVLLRQKFFGNAAVKAIFFLPVILGTGVFLSVQTGNSDVTNAAIDSAIQEGTGAMTMLQSMNIVKILQDIGVPAAVESSMYAFSNLLILSADMKTVDSYGRLAVDLIGSGTGYFVTGGKYVPIKWARSDINSCFTYTLEDGTALNLSRGTTYVGVIPTNGGSVNFS